MNESSIFPVEAKKEGAHRDHPADRRHLLSAGDFRALHPLLNKIISIPINLPIAQDNPNSKPDPDLVTLQVSESGSAYWNGEPIGMNEIEPRLSDYKSRFANPRVLVAGDNKAKWGPAVDALDAVRKSGIEQVSLMTTVLPTGRH